MTATTQAKPALRRDGTRADQPRLTIALTQAEYADHVDAYDGICLQCGEWTCGGVEPDASRYRCEDCGAHAVTGAENAMVAGRLTFTDEED